MVNYLLNGGISMVDKRIKELRKSLGKNQVEFGKCLNVTKQCISNWENGNILPYIDMLIKISTKFSDCQQIISTLYIVL